MDTTLTLPASLQGPVDEAIARAVGERWASRLWERDTSLWSSDHDVQDRIWARLGWLAAPTAFEAEAAELTAFGEAIEAEGFSDAIVMGMGGSSLAPGGPEPGLPGVGQGPHAPRARLDPSRRRGRPGRRARPAAHPARRGHQVGHHDRDARLPGPPLGGRGAPRGSLLERTRPATASSPSPTRAMPWRPSRTRTSSARSFLNPADVGGRYSALTYVGLVPAALLRLDVDALLEDARIMADLTRTDAEDNPALVLGAAMAALARAGRDKLTFVIEPDLASLGAWLEQLIAESTGKEGVGIVPVDGEPLGAPEVYGADRVFVRLGPVSDDEWHREVDAKLAALVAAGHPLIDIRLDDASWVAGEFFRWEFATAVAGIGLGVNPFDEPNVTESKHNTAAVLEIFANEGRLPHVEPAATRGALRAYTQPGGDGQPRDRGDLVAALRAHLARVPADGYFQVGAYVAPTRGAHGAPAPPAGQAARRHGQGLHARLRPALPALHRPAPQGRQAQRLLHPAHRGRRRRTCPSRAARRPSARSCGPRRWATSRPSAPTTCRPSTSTSATTSTPGWRSWRRPSATPWREHDRRVPGRPAGTRGRD